MNASIITEPIADLIISIMSNTDSYHFEALLVGKKLQK